MTDTHRRHHCALFAPAVLQAAVNDPGVDLRRATPLGHRLPNAVHCEEPTRPRVALLLFSECPSAIARLVVSVVLDPINRVLGRWTRTHIREEGLKRPLPSTADTDAAPAVEVIARMLRVVATLAHAVPDVVLRGVGPTVLVVVIALAGPSRATDAPARLRSPARQVLRVDIALLSAVAATAPVDFSVGPEHARENSPASKALAAQVSQLRHAFLLPQEAT